ncbi:hypothetical protein AAE478_010276 [Parahypoxylon ruwenzoriense]
MDLSYSEDRLTAVHGIAKSLAIKHHEEYFAGVFRSYLAQGLFWKGGGEGNKNEHFPTWLWASRQFSMFRKDETNGRPLVRCVRPQKFPTIDETADFSTPSRRILRLDAPVVSFDRLGVIKKGRLRHWRITDHGDSALWPGGVYGVDLDDELDYFPDLVDVKFLILMRCQAARRSRIPFYVGLVLQNSREYGEDTYKRIGTMETKKYGFAANVTNVESQRLEVSLI